MLSLPEIALELKIYEMKLDYHSPHLILNHFPSALFPVEFVFAAIGFYQQEPTFNYAAFYTLSAGVLLGWVAALAGLYDLAKIPKEKQVAQRTASRRSSRSLVVELGSRRR